MSQSDGFYLNSQLRRREACALLDVWQEVLGVLLDVDRVSGLLSFRGLRVAVPPKELFVLPGLEKYIGCRIGLLRTDIPHRPLCARLEEQTKRHEYDSIKEGIGREADGEVLA